ncbi:MAG: Na+/H+ antiporter subunit D [Vicinamibacterales bacterium]
MSVLVVLPVLVPMGAAVLALLAWRHVRLQRLIGLCGSFGLLAASIVLLRAVAGGRVIAVQMGSWPAPFGITLVADLLGAIMVVLAGMMGAAVSIYSLASIDGARERAGYHPLLQMLLAGVCGAFLTGDIFNLYVWFEVLLMASFVLMTLGGERPQIEGGLKYVTLNLIASALLLAAIGLLYGAAGTLNMADLANRATNTEPAPVFMAIAMLFMIAFGIKAAVFPLFFWLPASYHTPPIPVAAIFAGLLTKVGVYALLRVFTLLFTQAPGYTHSILLAISGLTMITGVLGAMAQGEVRRILSFHIVSQIGYMVMGLALFTPLAVAGSIFYVFHHIIVKTNLFLVAGLIRRAGGSFDLGNLGGLYGRVPWLAMLFLVPALSLAGVPPLSGFFAKLALVQAALAGEQYLIAAVALVVGLLTLFSMMKIWNEAFWKPAPGTPPAAVATVGTGAAALVGPSVALAMMTVVIGLGAEPAFRLALDAAHQLLDPRVYIAAVLEGRR